MEALGMTYLPLIPVLPHFCDDSLAEPPPHPLEYKPSYKRHRPSAKRVDGYKHSEYRREQWRRSKRKNYIAKRKTGVMVATHEA